VIRKSVLLVVLTGAVFAMPLAAAPLDAAQRWRQQLGDSAVHLKAGQYDAALKVAERVIRDMRERLGPGNAATEVLGIAITHKALALAGKGDREQALWWWHAVLSMYPPFAKSDLSAFGEPGAYLAANRELRPVTDVPGEKTLRETHKEVVAPRLLKKVQPDFPQGALWFGVEGKLILEVIINTDGRVSDPRVVQPLPAPTLTYAALDAVRRWRFAPAKLDGEIVATIFNLTVNFRAD
jgi:TonB family protein